jgi:hypothetical protein
MSLEVKHRNQASGNGNKKTGDGCLGMGMPLMLHRDRSSSYAGMLRRLRELDRSQRETGQFSTATAV